MTGIEKEFLYLRIAREGKIDPWGTIRLLSKMTEETGEQDFKSLIFQAGLPVWNERLVQYGKVGTYCAVNDKNTVDVVAEDGSIVEEIPHVDFRGVRVQKTCVHSSGYLLHILEPIHGSGKLQDIVRTVREIMQHTPNDAVEALMQVQRGERPTHLDNGSFTYVDKTFVGQELIELEDREHISRDPHKPRSLVYTENGIRIPSKSHRPLSYAKWDPTHPSAAHSIVDALEH